MSKQTTKYTFSIPLLSRLLQSYPSTSCPLPPSLSVDVMFLSFILDFSTIKDRNLELWVKQTLYSWSFFRSGCFTTETETKLEHGHEVTFSAWCEQAQKQLSLACKPPIFDSWLLPVNLDPQLILGAALVDLQLVTTPRNLGISPGLLHLKITQWCSHKPLEIQLFVSPDRFTVTNNFVP